MDKEKIRNVLYFTLMLLLFIGSSIFIYNQLSSANPNIVILILLIFIWLFSLLITSTAFFYDFFGIFEIIISYLPFMEFPFLLSWLYHRKLVAKYEISSDKLVVKLADETVREQDLKNILVVREGRQYGSKSLFRFKITRGWKTLIFDKDEACVCAKKLQKVVGRLRNKNQKVLIKNGE